MGTRNYQIFRFGPRVFRFRRSHPSGPQQGNSPAALRGPALGSHPAYSWGCTLILGAGRSRDSDNLKRPLLPARVRADRDPSEAVVAIRRGQ
jgi:hypothetical protein